MKKLITVLAAATMIAPAIAPAAAQAQDRRDDARYNSEYRNERVNNPKAAQHATPERGAKAKSWKRGDRFDRRQAANYRVLDHRQYRKLTPPPQGYRWVRSGRDAVLVGTDTGRVRNVVPGLFG